MNGQSAKPLELETWMQDVHQFSGEDAGRAPVMGCGRACLPTGWLWSWMRLDCCTHMGTLFSQCVTVGRSTNRPPNSPGPARSRQQLQAAGHAGGGASHAGGRCWGCCRCLLLPAKAVVAHNLPCWWRGTCCTTPHISVRAACVSTASPTASQLSDTESLRQCLPKT